MSLRAPVENENAGSVMPADSLSDPERFKVQELAPDLIRGSMFNVPSSNSELGTRNPEQQSTQARKDASGNIHVNLDSSDPC